MSWGKKCKKFKRTSIINNDVITALQDIINEAPELYFDEIAEDLGKATSVYLPHNTIHYVLHHRLNYTLQVCYESAKQQDETERERYKVALEFLIERVEDVGQIIVIDETHKDKRASRRCRAWGGGTQEELH